LQFSDFFNYSDLLNKKNISLNPNNLTKLTAKIRINFIILLNNKIMVKKKSEKCLGTQNK